MAERSAGSQKFSAEERAAMKQRAAELKAAKKGADAEAAVRAVIDAMDGPDRQVAEGLHALVREVVPGVACKTWYGFPSYLKGSDIVVFYQPAAKFGTRYGTIGFNDVAALDDGSLWPAAYAVTEWTDEVAERVRSLLERAFA